MIQHYADRANCWVMSLLISCV